MHLLILVKGGVFFEKVLSENCLSSHWGSFLSLPKNCQIGFDTTRSTDEFLFQPPKKSAQEINTTIYALIYRFKAGFGLILTVYC